MAADRGFLVLLAGTAGVLVWQLRKLTALSRQRPARPRPRKARPTHGARRSPLHSRTDRSTLAARKPGETTILADFDLDHFKDINDSLGYDIGDQVLAAIGQRLRTSIAPDAVCGRLGGDEFVVAMNAENAESAMKDMSALLDILSRPAWVSDRAVQIGVSTGLVEAPLHGVTRDDLIRRASFALRVAKSRGRSRLIVLIRAWTWNSTTAVNLNASSGARSPGRILKCITSRSSRRTDRGSSASRRWRDGRIRSTDRSGRSSSFRLPNRPA